MINKIFLVLIFFATSITSCKKKEIIVADADFQKKTMEALLKAKPDSTIELPEGKFQLDASLSLSVNNVKIKGQGMDKTILSFKGQSSGAEGLLVTADGFSIEDLSIEDTKGDALKIKGGNGITIRRVRTAWTGGPNEKNGAYGIYPVQCKNILIEDSVAIGASDSGIYVGQSSNIIVRRNKAEFNVAGIEIENSTFADVYENTATNNTGGILVFDLPDLPIQGGKNTRVFKNEIFKVDSDVPNKSCNVTLEFSKKYLTKIILTTDTDLIKDGVQETPDEFLEWFVKNPSCEEVEVKKECCGQCDERLCEVYDTGIGWNKNNTFYEIIIPKEKDYFPDIKIGSILSSEDIANEITELENQSFEGWTTDSIKGYLLACKNIKEKLM
jgi:parallel beta-helix repeat protein